MRYWVQDLEGTWFSFQIPLSLAKELAILEILESTSEPLDVLTLVVSEVLEIPPAYVDQNFTSEHISFIADKVIHTLYAESTSPTVVDRPSEASSIKREVLKVVAFLAKQGVSVSDALSLPREDAMMLLEELSKLHEQEMNFQVHISALNALSMAVGGEPIVSSNSPSGSNVDSTSIDLTNLDEAQLHRLSEFGVEFIDDG